MGHDLRFDVPLFTISEAARHLGVGTSRVWNWADTGLVHRLPSDTQRGAVLPFVALVESHMLSTLRNAGLSMRSIKEAVERLREDLGEEYALAWRQLAHNGRDVLRNISDQGDAPEWQRVRDRQGGLDRVVELGLQPVVWGKDDYPERLHLTAYAGADVIVDPRFSFGQPILEDIGIRVEDVLDLFKAGEPVSVVVDEFGVQPSDVEALLRVALRAA